ncbi:MAG: hypothetical protein ABDH29_07865 [Aquificaceae bacterium]
MQEILKKNRGGFYRREVIERVKENIRKRYSEIGFLGVYGGEEEWTKDERMAPLFRIRG